MDIFNIFKKYSLNFFIPYTIVYGVIGLFKYSAAVSSIYKKRIEKTNNLTYIIILDRFMWESNKFSN